MLLSPHFFPHLILHLAGSPVGAEQHGQMGWEISHSRQQYKNQEWYVTPLCMYVCMYYYMTTPARGFSGPVQLNGIGRMHVKAPLAAANGHEWSRSKATSQMFFDLCKDQTTTLGTPCPTLHEWCVGSLTSHSYLQQGLWDGTSGLLSLSEKTWKSNHLQM